jgi:hypothetical protein
MAKIDLIKLKANCKKAQLKLNDLREQIEEAENKKAIPELRKRYEGKFFKYRNSCSGEEKWWFYSFCKKIKSKTYAEGDCFEATPYENKFQFDHDLHYFMFETEITEQEYMNALTDFLSKAQLMRSNVINSGA